eukprot:CAMPEP_0115002098 /NCGR_PEP_ID=MMETSP0216-20121206/17799_1 /TAXON_ID=223996 /ORGANISM="Protocruzia adherens, Strain Boccale" /LENGTH=935 /DNA_ID=CAMNT_0002367619 /DNA_START=178 /DNA_END=2985 /DNA_ORIENTATION=+
MKICLDDAYERLHTLKDLKRKIQKWDSRTLDARSGKQIYLTERYYTRVLELYHKVNTHLGNQILTQLLEWLSDRARWRECSADGNTVGDILGGFEKSANMRPEDWTELYGLDKNSLCTAIVNSIEKLKPADNDTTQEESDNLVSKTASSFLNTSNNTSSFIYPRKNLLKDKVTDDDLSEVPSFPRHSNREMLEKIASYIYKAREYFKQGNIPSGKAAISRAQESGYKYELIRYMKVIVEYGTGCPEKALSAIHNLCRGRGMESLVPRTIKANLLLVTSNYEEAIKIYGELADEYAKHAEFKDISVDTLMTTAIYFRDNPNELSKELVEDKTEYFLNPRNQMLWFLDLLWEECNGRWLNEISRRTGDEPISLETNALLLDIMFSFNASVLYFFGEYHKFEQLSHEMQTLQRPTWLFLWVSVVGKSRREDKRSDVLDLVTTNKKTPFPLAHQLSGRMYKKEEKIDLAIKSYSLAYEQDPVNVVVCLELANLYISKQDFEVAVDLLSKALETDPSKIEIYTQMMQLHAYRGHHNKVIEQMDKYISAYRNTNKSHQDPEDGALYAMRGKAEFELGQAAKACESYMKASQCEPFNSSFVTQRFQTYLLTPDFDWNFIRTKYTEFFSSAEVENRSFAVTTREKLVEQCNELPFEYQKTDKVGQLKIRLLRDLKKTEEVAQQPVEAVEALIADLLDEAGKLTQSRQRIKGVKLYQELVDLSARVRNLQTKACDHELICKSLCKIQRAIYNSNLEFDSKSQVYFTIEMSRYAERDLKEKWLGQFVECLKRNKIISRLTLANLNLGTKGMVILSKVMRQETAIRELRLCQNRLEDAGAKEVASMLLTNTGIVAIDINRNEIGPDGGQAIANCLKKNKTLEILSMECNHIGVNGLKSFGKVFQSQSEFALKKLLVKENEISDGKILDLVNEEAKKKDISLIANTR